jgi:putative transposase
MNMLVATDFFTTEVWTWGELVTYDVLFSIHLWSRRVQIAGATPHPNEPWMMQIASNMTMADWGFLEPGQYVIHDREGNVPLFAGPSQRG